MMLDTLQVQLSNSLARAPPDQQQAALETQLATMLDAARLVPRGSPLPPIQVLHAGTGTTVPPLHPDAVVMVRLHSPAAAAATALHGAGYAGVVLGTAVTGPAPQPPPNPCFVVWPCSVPPRTLLSAELQTALTARPLLRHLLQPVYV